MPEPSPSIAKPTARTVGNPNWITSTIVEAQSRFFFGVRSRAFLRPAAAKRFSHPIHATTARPHQTPASRSNSEAAIRGSRRFLHAPNVYLAQIDSVEHPYAAPIQNP